MENKTERAAIHPRVYKKHLDTSLEHHITGHILFLDQQNLSNAKIREI